MRLDWDWDLNSSASSVGETWPQTCSLLGQRRPGWGYVPGLFQLPQLAVLNAGFDAANVSSRSLSLSACEANAARLMLARRNWKGVFLLPLSPGV